MASRRIILGLLVAIFFSAQSTSVLAQKNLNNEKSIGIQVSPVIEEFDINKGETLAKKIIINGLTKQTVTYYPVALNFEADEETGKPVFQNIGEDFGKYSLSKWITFEEDTFVLLPGEEKTIRYTITAPSDASPGGHYAAVLFSTEEPEFDKGGSFVGVVGLIGTLVLATTPGDIIKNLILNEFIGPTILFKPPADFLLKIGNNGNVHLRPEGGITIRNWFGKQTIYLPVNESDGAILPDSQRRFDSSWGFSWSAVGKYTANLSLSYGNGKSLAGLRTFYVIPYWLIIAIGGIIILWLGKRYLRKRPKRQPPQPTQPPRRRVMG